MFTTLSKKEQSNQPQNTLPPKATYEARACATDQFQQKKKTCRKGARWGHPEPGPFTEGLLRCIRRATGTVEVLNRETTWPSSFCMTSTPVQARTRNWKQKTCRRRLCWPRQQRRAGESSAEGLVTGCKESWEGGLDGRQRTFVRQFLSLDSIWPLGISRSENLQDSWDFLGLSPRSCIYRSVLS